MVVTLDEIKLHCRVELDQDAEDTTLILMESAARRHTENVLQLPLDSSAGDNVRLAMLLLIGEWYRNRESASYDRLTNIPDGYEALLFPEKHFLTY